MQDVQNAHADCDVLLISTKPVVAFEARGLHCEQFRSYSQGSAR